MLPQHSSKSNEWYTPEKYVEAAREVMRCIHLDPASCEEANRTVQAVRFFTEEDNGLRFSWLGRVWLNPPYGRTNGVSNQEIWSEKLISEYETGSVVEAILLVNNATDTGWYQNLTQYTICLTSPRIRFDGPTKKKDQPAHGNTFVYFGENEEKFIEVFTQFGTVYPKGTARRKAA